MASDSKILTPSSQQNRKWFLALMVLALVFAQFHGEFSLQARLRRDLSSTPDELHSSQLSVDILSIGSKRRPQLLSTQRQTFGSHVTVRNFFNATEADDDDPHCDSHLTPEDAFKISHFCRNKQWNRKTHFLMRFLGNAYANSAWLKKKASPVGWMCAQRRPLHGLYKVFQKYKNSGESLPDYLIVIDDDTYFNLEQFQKLVQEDNRSVEDPAVLAGCLIRMPVMTVNFTIPFGGFGTIFNRASLERLLEPIHCGDGNEQSRDTCAQVQRNLIGEQELFQDGMNVLELIKAFVNYQPYKDFPLGNWTDGYCMHSDWVLGFFVNHYNISSHVRNPWYKNVPQSRIEEWHGSVTYKRAEGFCNNENVDNCRPDSVTCHYMTSEAMVNYTDVVKAKALPGQFRDIGNTTEAVVYR